MRHVHAVLIAIGLAGVFAGAAGCANNTAFATEERLAKGLVVILPGIEGVSPLNENIRRGLDSAGCDRALFIHAWGAPLPGVGMMINQMDALGNRLRANGVVRLITDYQDRYPGRPVHVIGHSGGGGIAVFAAEALPDGRAVDGLVLLSASLSQGYDLAKALTHCRCGIVNFHNPADTGLLGVGTTVAGNVDGVRGPSAGLNGFQRTYPRLWQVRVTGGLDPHAAATRPAYVRRRVAPWILSSTWPAR